MVQLLTVVLVVPWCHGVLQGSCGGITRQFIRQVSHGNYHEAYWWLPGIATLYFPQYHRDTRTSSREYEGTRCHGGGHRVKLHGVGLPVAAYAGGPIRRVHTYLGIYTGIHK